MTDEGSDVDAAEYAVAVHAFLNPCGALPYAWDAIDRISGFLRLRLGAPARSATRLQHVALLYDAHRVDDACALYGGLLGLVEKPPPAAFADTGIVWLDAGSDHHELHLVPADFPDAHAKGGTMPTSCWRSGSLPRRSTRTAGRHRRGHPATATLR